MNRRKDSSSPRRARVAARPSLPPGPLRDLKEFIYAYYLKAQPVTLAEIADRIASDDSLSGCPSKDTIGRCISAPDLPSNQDDVVALVRTLAATYGDDPDVVETRARDLWAAAAIDSKPLSRDMANAHSKAVWRRYRNLDMAVLSPDTLDDASSVSLMEVFLPQLVREDRPPDGLPKDLWRQLVAGGDILVAGIPADVDIDLIVKAQQVHLSQAPQAALDVIHDPRNRLIVLLGDPGSGKSSLARYLVLRAAQICNSDNDLASVEISILIDLSEYVSQDWRTGSWSDGTFLDFVDYKHTHEGLGFPIRVLEAHLRSGRSVLLVLDGLDEIFSPVERAQVSSRIGSLSDLFPTAKIVVTSRIVGYSRKSLEDAGFSLYTLQDLDKDQIARFVRGWYTSVLSSGGQDVERLTTRLLNALSHSRSARELAGNPMLLTILAAIGRRRDLPRERHRVYEHAVNVLVQHWDLNKPISDARLEMNYIDEEDKREILRRIARFMQSDRHATLGNHIYRGDLADIIRGYLQDQYQLRPESQKIIATALEEQLQSRNFILSRLGPGLYSFIHRALLEYCCADDITFRLKETQEISADTLASEYYGKRALDPAWTEILMLMAGMVQPRVLDRTFLHLAKLSRKCSNSQNAGRHLLLAFQCLCELRTLREVSASARALVLELISTLGDMGETHEPVAEIVIDRIRKTLPLLRELATSLPGRELLLDEFLHPSTSFRRAGRTNSRFLVTFAEIVASVNFDSSTLFNELLDRALARLPATREAAVVALSTHWINDESRAVIEDLARHDPSLNVRFVAIRALAMRWPDGVARGILQAVVVGNDDYSLRKLSTVLLADLWGTDEEFTLLVNCMTFDPAPHIRILMMRVLSEKWPNPTTVMKLVATIEEDTQTFVRKEAVQCLGRISRDKRTQEVLTHTALLDPSPYVRLSAAEVLATAWSNDEFASRTLERVALIDPVSFVRAAVMEYRVAV